MADRHELLARIVRVLSHAGIDGVMSTPDVVEDLLILSGLVRERGGQSPLDERLIVGCMNRGEMDDSFTAFTTRRMVVLGLDGGKVMLRVDPTDSGSHATIAGCVRAVTELAEANLLAFLEPLPVVRENGAYKVVRTAQALTEAVSVASAMGASSLYTWLEVPTCPDFEQVTRATTLPLVIQGGDTVGNPRPVIEDLRRGMASGPNIRGAMIGRNVLYPGAEDPVLRDISLVIEPGRTTAIVGSTGSGKSTLVNLIPRFYDVTGGSLTVVTWIGMPSQSARNCSRLSAGSSITGSSAAS